MPSPTRSNHRRIVGLVLSGLMGALLVVSKQAMSGLPNIEPVTLLIILIIMLINAITNKLTGASFDKGIGG